MVTPLRTQPSLLNINELGYFNRDFMQRRTISVDFMQENRHKNRHENRHSGTSFGDFCLDFRQNRTTFVNFNRDFNPENRQVERPLNTLVSTQVSFLENINMVSIN
jgi:hypothetical protein